MEDLDDWDVTSNVKSKNVFDDDVTFDEAKKLILNDLKNDDDLSYDGDEFETVNWNDVPVSKHSSNKLIDNLGTPSLATHKAQLDAKSQEKFGIPKFSTGGTGKVNTSKDLKSVSYSSSLDDFSIEDAVGQHKPSSNPEKLNEELKALRKSNLLLKRGRFSKLPVEDTIKRMLKGEAYTFELYRSLDDKLSLLDQAVKMIDGNCILAAVLFLKSTVKQAIFNYEISKRPQAVNHYITYLHSNSDFRELADILVMLGRVEEAAMLRYKVATSSALGSSKASALKNVYRNHFSLEQQLSSESALVQEHISLLERQLPIEDADAKEEAMGRNPLFRDIPRKRAITDMPLMTTLYYCCLYHYHLGENSLASPKAIKNAHQLSDRQYLFSAVGAQARLHNWKNISELLSAKGWFGSTKMKAAIGFDKVVEILHKYGAPSDILQQFISYISDNDSRLNIAKKTKCHKAVVDVYITLRDRTELANYTSTLKHGTSEYMYANDALRNSSIKWK